MRLELLTTRPLFAASLIALTAPSLAYAQAPPNGQASSPDEAGAAAAAAGPAVVVTANRAPTPIGQVAQSVTVLTTTQLRQDQETNLGDILARTPGVSFVRNGGPGQTTSLFIRGADSEQTVVLIDGVKVNDATSPSGAFDFSNLIMGDISRVEVLRGTQSTLYGSDAIGGVVNIVTADATKPFQGEAQAEGGSYGTAYARASVGGTEDRISWRLGGYYDATSGISDFDKALGGREPDAYQTFGGSGRVRIDLLPNLQLDERAYYSKSRADLDGFDNPTFTFGDDGEYENTSQFVDYTGLNLSLLGGRLKNRLAYQYDALDRRSFDPDSSPEVTFDGTGRTNTVEYEGTFAIAPGYQAVFGAEDEQSAMTTSSPAFFTPVTHASANIASGYGLLTGEVIPGLTLSGGVRYDSHSRFGGHVTGQASAAWSLNGGNTILRASFGEGFKAPTLYQLYSEYGNTALKPEQSQSWEVGIEQHFLDGRLMVAATYFGRDTNNLINFFSCFDSLGNESTAGLCATHQLGGGYYVNVGKASAQGAELQADWRATDRLSFSANYTYDDTEDRSPGSATFGYQLARRPKHAANLSASYVWPLKLRTEIAVRYAGDSFNDLAHTVRLKAYTLVDLRVSYPLRDNIELYGRIENLADEHYETAFGYGTLGRAFYGGVRVSF